jgi:hypothetical protein
MQNKWRNGSEFETAYVELGGPGGDLPPALGAPSLRKNVDFSPISYWFRLPYLRQARLWSLPYIACSIHWGLFWCTKNWMRWCNQVCMIRWSEDAWIEGDLIRGVGKNSTQLLAAPFGHSATAGNLAQLLDVMSGLWNLKTLKSRDPNCLQFQLTVV